MCPPPQFPRSSDGIHTVVIKIIQCRVERQVIFQKYQSQGLCGQEDSREVKSSTLRGKKNRFADLQGTNITDEADMAESLPMTEEGKGMKKSRKKSVKKRDRNREPLVTD